MEERDPYASLNSFISQFATESAGATAGQQSATPPAGAGTQPPAATPPTTPTTPPPAGATPPATSPATPPPAAGTTPPATPPADTDPPFDAGNLFGTGKQNATFAQMRIQNKAMASTLAKVAQTLGIDTSDPVALLAALDRRVNEHQAEATGVPLATLERLDKLTRDADQREADAMAAEATRGFQRVKDEFHLSNKDLSDFAVQLRDAGRNPFATPMDLLTEYKTLNFSKLMEKARNDALTEATRLQQHGEQHSTQPGTAAPAAAPGSAKSVTTVSGLEDLMKTLQ